MPLTVSQPPERFCGLCLFVHNWEWKLSHPGLRSEVPGCLCVAMSITHGLDHGLKVTLWISHCSGKGEKQFPEHPKAQEIQEF